MFCCFDMETNSSSLCSYIFKDCKALYVLMFHVFTGSMPFGLTDVLNWFQGARNVWYQVCISTSSGHFNVKDKWGNYAPEVFVVHKSKKGEVVVVCTKVGFVGIYESQGRVFHPTPTVSHFVKQQFTKFPQLISAHEMWT